MTIRADRPRHRRMLGLAIRKRRAALGISQEKLAELADIHRNYVGLIERAQQNLTIDSLVRLARALGSRPSDLLRDGGL